AQPLIVDGTRVGNRFCILPMEGWDGTTDGEPTDLTRRRWRNFGLSGAKLIWGGEAVAVRHDGRANPNQLLMTSKNQPSIASLPRSWPVTLAFTSWTSSSAMGTSGMSCSARERATENTAGRSRTAHDSRAA